MSSSSSPSRRIVPAPGGAPLAARPRGMEPRTATFALLALLLLPAAAPAPVDGAASGGTIASRIPPPPGHTRGELPAGSFGAWLRALPALPGRPDVLLHDGRPKANQEAHHLVLALDVGAADLQQCADAVMRLRAEWLRASGRADEICFRFTSGDAASWRRYRQGERPTVKGARVTWSRTAAADAGDAAFRRYLDLVFTYAGTASLARELLRVDAPARPEIGDVYLQGGHPGHAVIVVDVADDSAGERRFLLAQSYMPAQQLHVLRNPADPASPWYRVPAGELRTPEWTFVASDLRRFGPSCAAP